MSTRTQVGIVEWARRIAAAVAAELVLAGRGADLWKTVLPVLPDVVVDPLPGLVADRSVPPLSARLDAAYRAWATETTPVAEGPIAARARGRPRRSRGLRDPLTWGSLSHRPCGDS